MPEDTKLVIIPDAGSNQYLEHKTLKEEGKDILVIDHHEAMMESEDACVINNQFGDYPTKSLCGGAMVLKFCTYIDELLGTNNAKEYIDLAALALISDMMDIRDFETIEYIR
jgi:single-stranded-DNA-specific exonuclease